MERAKVEIDAERWARIQALPLAKGSHTSIGEGACLMEAVAFVAGERWSDHPQCACPVLGAFMRSWNDSLNDEDRERLLKPLVPRLVGTKSTTAVEERRAYIALDWYLREMTPAFLDLVEALKPAAEALRGASEIRDLASARAVRQSVLKARDEGAAARAAAWDAARDAAGAAAWDAAWDAARAAAGDAAWDAAGDAAGAAARDAARAAAWDAAGAAARAAAGAAAGAAARAAARDAARDAARAAAGAALRPTVERLQASALEMVDRMLSVGV